MDFADINWALKGGGLGFVSSGIGKGRKRIENAIQDALKLPLCDGLDISEAKRLLLNFTYGKEENVSLLKDMDTIKPVKGGLEFHVQGFKHTGMVQIILDEGKDLFEIHLIPDSEGERKIIEDVYFDMLVSIIDENVEKTDDYEKRISDTYDIIRY